MIYQRQKVLLTLLRESTNSSASKIQFVKWLFLLREEENIDRYVNFYDFFPYKYGPFSFLAYKDIAELERFGWVKSDSSSFRYTVPEKEADKLTLPPDVTRSIEKIIEKYGRLSQQSLIKYVYGKYPWYASRSKIGHSNRPIYTSEPRPAIYSLGYEGLSIDAFLDVILKAEIKAVVDSRNNPISRKYGFSKPILADKCSDVGIEYHHFPELGIPSEVRRQIQDKHVLWDLYAKEIMPRKPEILRSIASICKADPSVLICFEEKPEDCHRHIIARELSMRTSLPVIHYRKTIEKWQRE